MTIVAVDAYVLDTLMPDLVRHDRRPAAFVLYLHLWARTAAVRGRPVVASYAELAADTGLSKSAVQVAARHLRRRRLVAVERDSATATPRYTVLRPWHRRRAEG